MAADRKVTAMLCRSEADRIGLKYLALAYRVRKVLDEHMIGGGLSLARAKVLQVLQKRGPVRQGILAQELGYAPRSVTQAVEGLEREGFLIRRADPDDLRAKVVVLTDQGSASLAAGWVAGSRVLEEIFGLMGPTLLANLDDLLDAIEAATEEVDTRW
jgi:DNA-binding MarR family transcriptional regulator